MSTTPFGDLIKRAAEAKFEVIPANDYAVICKDASATKASTGKDMIKITASVVVGPYKGSNVFTQQVLTPENPAAVQIFLKALDAFGLDSDFLTSLPPREDGGPDLAAVARALKGRAAGAKVNVREWNGEDRNEVTRFFKLNAEMEAAVKEALSEGGMGADPFAAPTAGPADPFAASAAGGGKADGDPF